MVKEVMQDELESILKEKKIVIIDFSATWCGPCKSLSKLLEEKVVPLIENDPDVVLIKIDIDKNRDFTQAMQIKGVPAMMFFYKGELFKFEDDKGPTDRIVGFRYNLHLNIMEIVNHLKSKRPSLF
jgi:thioredoxin 1